MVSRGRDEERDNTIRKYSMASVTILKLCKFLHEVCEGEGGIPIYLYNAKFMKDFIFLGTKVIILLVQ